METPLDKTTMGKETTAKEMGQVAEEEKGGSNTLEPKS